MVPFVPTLDYPATIIIAHAMAELEFSTRFYTLAFITWCVCRMNYAEELVQARTCSRALRLLHGSSSKKLWYERLTKCVYVQLGGDKQSGSK